MKIDSIINEIKDTTDEVIIITSKKSIDTLLDDISSNSNISAQFNNTKSTKKIKSIHRGGITFHFIDAKDINDNIFYNSISEYEI